MNFPDFPILMTASVDTRGMKTAMYTAQERETMYVETIRYYVDLFNRRGIRETLVFAENSGYNQRRILDRVGDTGIVTIEYHDLGTEGFRQEMGKGRNELLLIDRTVDTSEAIRKAGRFFKVTGRFAIRNVDKLMEEAYYRGGQEQMQYYCDVTDHRLYEWLHIKGPDGHRGECRYYACSTDFYRRYLYGKYKYLGDVDNIYVGTLLLSLARHVKGKPNVTCRFRTQAYITGLSGHNKGRGSAFFHSRDENDWAHKVKRDIRQVLRWIVTGWWI